MNLKKKFRKRYDALTIPPQRPGEWDWVDRLRTWEEFKRMGPRVANLLADLKQKNSPADYEREYRSLCPALHDLLMEAYAKKGR